MTSQPTTMRHTATVNLAKWERVASLLGGGALLTYGLMRRGKAGFALAAASVPLMERAATGHSRVYQKLGVHTDRRQGRNLGVPYELGTRVDKSITIDRPPEELYRYWRNLENLPRFMKNVESVRMLDEKRSHWVVKGPMGRQIEWEAEIVNEVEPKVIGWRSVPGRSRVDTGGSVRFEPAPGNRGTEVHVSLQYNPPGGDVGAVIAKMLGGDPATKIEDDLRRFKQLMEAGEIATVQGQTSGRQAEYAASHARKKGWSRDVVAESSEESFPASDAPSWTPEALGR